MTSSIGKDKKKCEQLRFLNHNTEEDLKKILSSILSLIGAQYRRNTIQKLYCTPKIVSASECDSNTCFGFENGMHEKLEYREFMTSRTTTLHEVSITKGTIMETPSSREQPNLHTERTV